MSSRSGQIASAFHPSMRRGGCRSSIAAVQRFFQRLLDGSGWLPAALTVCLLVVAPASAQVVTTLADNLASPPAGSLRAALNTANASGSAASITFNISGGGTINLAGALPILRNPNGISIDGANGGQGAVTIDGGSSSNTTGDRIFFLGVRGSDNTGLSGTPGAAWSIANLTLQNGNARGGAGGNGGSASDAYSGGGGGAGLGGALFVNEGNATLSNVQLVNNRATGGNGGTLSGPTGSTGAGGGMGGNGGSAAAFTGGGGGGFGLGANGGNGNDPSAGAGSLGRWTGGTSAGTGSGAGGANGGASGGGGGGASNNQNGGGGGPGGQNGTTTGAPGGAGKAGDGGFGGGGGAGGGNNTQVGGTGGFGGGGGGGGAGDGGSGGFGGGGGGGAGSPVGAGGFGAGDGAGGYGGGGGGAGLGGAIFVRQGATLTLTGSSISGGIATGGGAGPNASVGQGIGTAAFLAGPLTWSVPTGQTITLAGTLGGGSAALVSGGLTKTGAGTLVLNANHSYVGATAITGGQLQVNGSLAGTGALSVSSGATLSGSGTISGAGSVASGGILAPGAGAPGRLNTANLTLAAGATLAAEITGATVATQYDQLDVTGTINLGGATLTLSGGFTPSGGQSFVLIDNDGSDAVTGTFAGLAQGATLSFNGVNLGISYNGGDGNDVVLTVADPCAAFVFPYTLTGADNTARVANLRSAIQCANLNGSADVIDLNGLTVTLSDSFGNFFGATGLPQVTTTLTVRNGALNRSGPNELRFFSTSGNLTLRDLTLTNGGGTTYPSNGGSITTEGLSSVLNVINTTISGSRIDSLNNGSAINSNRTLTVVNSHINGGGFGRGAIVGFNGPILIQNTSIAGNSAGSEVNSAGALYIANASATIVNSTIVGNYTGATGADRSGGIVAESGIVNLTVRNSIVWGNRNSGNTAPQIRNLTGGTTVVSNSLIEGGFAGGSNIVTSDPLFVVPLIGSATPSTAGNFQLGDASPAIDAGANADVPADTFDVNGNSNTTENAPDLAGNPRRYNDTGVTDTGSGSAPIVDLGTYEKQTNSPPPTPSVSIAVFPSSVLEDGSTNLDYTVTLNQAAPSALNVNFSVSGTATSGSDFSAVGTSLTIPAGLTSGTVTVNPTADTNIEADESVILTLAAGSGYTVGSPSSATGTIQNDDADPCAAISFPYTLPNNLPATLTQAIQCANANGTADVINLNGQTVTLTASFADYSGATALPQVTAPLTVRNGTITRTGLAEFRFFNVSGSGINLTLRDLTLTNGGGTTYASIGGSVASLSSSTLTVVNTRIAGSKAAELQNGSAIFSNGPFTMVNSSVVGNASSRGALAINNGPVLIQNTLLSGNVGPNTINSGGALYLSNMPSAVIENSTITGNYILTAVNTQPAGIFASAGTVNLTIRNSIIWGNSNNGNTSPQVVNSTAGTTTVSNSIIQGGPFGALNVDPLFMTPITASATPSTAGDFALQSNSPAIDAGANANVPADALDVDGDSNTSEDAPDRTGNPRRYNDTGVADTGSGTPPIVDLGAFEKQTNSANPCGGVTFPYTLPNNLPATLIQAIECANANATADMVNLNGQTVTLTASFADYAGATGLPQVTSDLTLRNGTVTRSGSNEFRLLSASTAATLRLTDLTLSNGGGAAYASFGAGLSSEGSLLLTRVTMSGHLNTQTGGAIAIPTLQSGATVSILDSTLSGNTALGGGAIYFLPGASGGTLTLAGSTLASNVGTGGPGAIFISGLGASLNVRNSTFSANSSSNTAAPDAIGVFVGAQADIAFSTFSGHDNGTTASTVGIIHAVSGASVNLRASMIANNVRTGGGSARECTTSSATFTGTTNYAADTLCPGRVGTPTFVDTVLANNGGPTQTHLPAPHSNVVNADSGNLCGPASLNLAVDQRGQPRARGPSCDLGAVEIDACGAITFPYSLPNNTPATLNAAIDCANSTATIADVINLNGQTVTLTQTANDAGGETGVLSVRSPITLQNGTLTRSGSNEFRLLHVNGGGNLTLRDLTLSNGGGAAYGDLGNLISTNTGSTLTIIRGVLTGGSGSTGSSGGAIFASGTLNLINSTIYGNSAGRGGAITAQNGPLLIANSVISGNVATNTTSSGGGAMTLNAMIVNDARIINSTIAGNYAAGSNRTGGIAGETSGVDLILQNSIVWGNGNAGTAAPQIVNTAVSSTNTATNSLIEGGLFGALNSDPLFVTPLTASATPSTAGNFALQNNSPAIDAGANAFAPADGFDVNGNSNTSEDAPDHAGNPRRYDDTGVTDTGSGTAPIVDLGAFERQTNSVAPADFNITTTASSITVVDNTSNGSTLLATEPVPDNLRFDAAGRTFSINGGPPMSGNSGNLALAGITSITVNASGGTRVEPAAFFNIGASTYASASSITLAGGTLKTTGSSAVVNAPIVLAADSDVAGNMRLAGVISGDFTLRTFGTGSYRFASTASSFARLQIASGTVVLEGNNTLPPQIDIFNSASFNLNGFSQSIDFYASSGSTQNTGAAANLTIGVAGSASSFGTANYSGPISGPINLSIAAGANQIFSSNSSNYSGTTAVSGTLQVRGSSSLGAAGPGNGTTVASTGTLDLRNVAYASSEALVLDGGNLDVSSGNSSFPGTITLNSSGNDIRVAAGSTLSLDGVVSGSQGFSMLGGILVLTQANTFSGPLAVNSGSLRVLGSTAAASSVTINNGVLEGIGTVGGPLSINGTSNLAPGVGSTSGILHTANVVLVAGSNALFNIDGATLGSQYDQLDVNGTISLMGADLFLVGSFVPTIGQDFVLIDNDGSDPVTGTFAGLPQGGTRVFNGVPLTISYVGGDGNDVVLTAVETSVGIAVAPASVPENGAGNLIYTVTRSASLPSATTVNIGTTGTATSGSDYSGAVATVVIPANAATATITIDPTPDSTFEPDETVILTVAAGSGYTVGAPVSATGTITNDDADPCLAITFPYTLAGADNTARVANLRQAIQCANLNGTADSIDLNAQTVTLNDVFADYTGATGLPQITTEITLENGSISRDSGAPQFRFMAVSATGHLILEGVNLSGGSLGGLANAGAILNDAGMLTLRNSTVSGNSAGFGGAIYNTGTVMAVNSQFTGNSASQNSGFLMNDNAIATIIGSTISGNSSSGTAGNGAIFNADGALDIIDSTISGNTSTSSVGAVQNSGGTTRIANSIFAGNSAVSGTGAVLNNAGGQMTISNSALTGNSAGTGAGALFNNVASTLTISNSTIAGNRATSSAGILISSGSTATLRNSIVWGNGSNTLASATITYSVIEGGFTGTGNLSVDPLFSAPVASASAPTTAGDYRLQASSPATDAGDNAAVPLDTFDLNDNASTTDEAPDLDGNPRRYDDIGAPDTGAGTAPIVDMGAYERQTGSPFEADLSITKTDGQTTDIPGTSITYTIVASNAGPLAVGTATVADTFPANITGVSWTCVGASGGSCPAAGSGNLNATVGLPVGGSVSFTATGTISAAATGTLSNTATVNSAVTDPVPGNDSATDTTTLASLPQLSVSDVSRNEGNSGTTQFDFTVNLSSAALAGGVSFDIATANGTATAGSDYLARALTGQSIPAGSSNYTFSVQVNGDAVAEASESFFVNVSNVTGASLGDGQGLGTIGNDDTAGVALVESGGDTAVTEGGSNDNYTLALTSQPSADVTLVLDAGAQLIASPATVTFTPANWNVAQTVNVGAVNDGVVEGPHTGTLTHATSGGGYDGVAAPELLVDITDNDAVEVVFSGVDTATPLNEQGSVPDTYTVRLGSIPAGGNSVSITIDPASDCQVQIGAGATLPVATLTTSTQANTTVRIFAVNDQLLEGPQDCAVSYTIDSADPAYDALTRATDTYAVVDNESASYGIAALPLFEPISSGDEGSSPATLAVYALLNASGTGMLGIETPFDVSYSATAGTATGGGTDYNLPAGSVRFDASTPLVGANAVESFTFNVIDDLLDETDETLFAQVAANEAGTSGAYDAAIALLPSRQSHTYTILDNDSAAIIITPTSGLVTTEAGGTASFTVVLGSQPTAAVNVGLSSSDPSEGTVAPTGLSFSTANWNVAQTVTVTGVDDALDDGDVAYSIVTALATSADSSYAGLDPADVALSNTDNDAVGVAIVQSAGTTTVTEGGATDSFTVVLSSQPTATVSIALSGTQVTPTPSPLSFTTANWNSAQTVTVTAVDDAVAEGAHVGSVGFVVSSSDSAYQGAAVPALSVDITDNDSAAIIVTPTSGLATTEAGGTASFTVVLGSQPTAAVSVGLSSSDPSEGTVAPTGLSFSTANWNVAQTVTVTGVDDALDDGDVAYNIVTALATSADSSYAGLDPADVALSNTDNDAAPSFSPGPALSRQQGSAASSGVIGTVADADEAAAGLQVSQIAGGTASGITVSALSNSNGLVSAQLAASCSATDGTLRFEVRDATALTATAEVQIDVLDNSAPQLVYGNQALSFGGSATVTPSSGPTDNGSVVSISLQDAGTFAGTISVGGGGVVSLGNAQPAGGHIVLIRATDDCGASTDVPLNLSVGPTSTFKLVTADVSPSRFGQPVTFSAQLVGINPTGSVEFFAGGSSLGTAPLTASPSGGNNLKLASLVTSALPVGSAAITAVYAGDASNAASTSPVLPHSVLAAATRVQVGTASNPATPGSQTIHVTVSAQAPGGGVPQGSVTVTAGALQCTATLTAGSGSCALNLGTPGMIALGASYSPGNGNHLPSAGGGAVVIVATPSSTDLRVRIGNGLRNLGPGQTITWMVVVDNLGQEAAVGRLEVPLGAGMTGASWFCSAAAGAQCTGGEAGVGAIDSSLSLAPGGVLIYAFSATIAAGPEQPLTQTATITPVSPTTDPVLANNTASDTDPMGLLADGFEAEVSE